MYKVPPLTKTTIKQNKTYEGERIEEKINRILNNKEPIKDGAPLVYTNRKDGVLASTNIRSDRFEIAIEATDAIYKSNIAQREAFHKELDAKNSKNKPEKIEGNPPTGEQKPAQGDQNTKSGNPSQ